MIDDPIATLDDIMAKATPGPWRSERCIHSFLCDEYMIRERDAENTQVVRSRYGSFSIPILGKEDAAAIVALRNCWPALRRIVRAAEEIRRKHDFLFRGSHEWQEPRIRGLLLALAYLERDVIDL